MLVVHIVSPLVLPHSPTSYSTSANSKVELVAESSPFCVLNHHPQYHWSKILLESWSDNCNFCSCGLGAALLGPTIVTLTMVPLIAARNHHWWMVIYAGTCRGGNLVAGLGSRSGLTEEAVMVGRIGRIGMTSLVRP